MLPLEIQQLVAAVRSVLPAAGGPIALHEPEFAGREWEYVKSCLEDGWVSSVGPFVDRFEAELARVCGVRFAVATMNGTAALHGAMMALGIGRGDEVLVPALTFVATVNAVSYTGATPHFVDSDSDRLGIDPTKLESHLESIAEPAGETSSGPVYRNRHTGRPLKAVVSMHVFGHPVDADAVNRVAARYGLVHVEDAAEALGSTYKGRPAGSLARVAALSFNGNKIVTTGGGGAILTDDPELASRVRHLCTTAKLPHAWAYRHDEVGYNYRLPNLNAALGCAQLEQLPGMVARKRKLATAYRAAIAPLPGLEFVDEPADSSSIYWLNAVKLPPHTNLELRDRTLAALQEAGFLCRPVWALMPSLPMYRDCPAADLAVAQDLARRIINLPSSARLAVA